MAEWGEILPHRRRRVRGNMSGPPTWRRCGFWSTHRPRGPRPTALDRQPALLPPPPHREAPEPMSAEVTAARRDAYDPPEPFAQAPAAETLHAPLLASRALQARHTAPLRALVAPPSIRGRCCPSGALHPDVPLEAVVGTRGRDAALAPQAGLGVRDDASAVGQPAHLPRHHPWCHTCGSPRRGPGGLTPLETGCQGPLPRVRRALLCTGRATALCRSDRLRPGLRVGPGLGAHRGRRRQQLPAAALGHRGRDARGAPLLCRHLVLQRTVLIGGNAARRTGRVCRSCPCGPPHRRADADHEGEGSPG